MQDWQAKSQSRKTVSRNQEKKNDDEEDDDAAGKGTTTDALIDSVMEVTERGMTQSSKASVSAKHE